MYGESIKNLLFSKRKSMMRHCARKVNQRKDLMESTVKVDKQERSLTDYAPQSGFFLGKRRPLENSWSH